MVLVLFYIQENTGNWAKKSLLFLDIIVIFPAFMEMVVYGKKYAKQILMDV